MFDLKAAGFSDPVLVAATDGVGTKLRVALEAGRHDTVGIDLVAMCVNDLVVQGAEPVFFLDYFACGSLNIDVASAVVAGIAEGCKTAGCALIGGETAEMPGMYSNNDYDLAGFSVGAVERGELLTGETVTEGDTVLGLASAGLHSNGFSLVRQVIDDTGAHYADEAPFAPEYSLGHALLTPTKIYVRSCLAALKTGGVRAFAHITGGGLTENVPRILPKDLAVKIDKASWVKPPVFEWLAAQGGIAEAEMLRTFNCGIGMIAIVDQGCSTEVKSVLEQHGETVFEVGKVTKREGQLAIRYKNRT